MAFVLLLSFLALGAGIIHAIAQRPQQPASYRSAACPSLAGAKVTSTLTVHTDRQPASYDLTEDIALPVGSRLARALADRSHPATLQQTRACLFSLSPDGYPSLVSSGHGLATFAISGNIGNGPVPFSVDGWTATTPVHGARLDFQPATVCIDLKGEPRYVPSWAGTDLTLTVVTKSAPSRVTPLPTAKRNGSYSWRFPKVTCGKLPHISVTVPISLASFTATAVRNSTVGGLPFDEVIGWSGPIVVVLIGLGLAWRIRDPGAPVSASRLVLTAALGIVAAAIDLAYSGHPLWGAVEIAASYGIALAVLPKPSPIPRRWVLDMVTVALLIAAVVTFAIWHNVSVTAAFAVEAVALRLVLAIGAIGYQWLWSAEVGGRRRIRGMDLRSLGDDTIFAIASVLAVALAYTLGNVALSAAPADAMLSQLAANEFAALRYPLAVFATLLVAVALVIPLARHGRAAIEPAVVAALFGWAVVAQLPAIAVAGIFLPGGEILLMYVLYRFAITKYVPIPNRSQDLDKLRTCLPRKEPLGNAMLAAKISAALAVIPVGYFTYTTITSLPVNLRDLGPGMFFIVGGILVQAAGWILTGVVFAGISTRLRGGNGPIRALVMSIAWLVAGLAVHVIDEWTQNPTGTSWSFFGFELLLFLVTFGVVWDAFILAAVPGKDSLNKLREVYQLRQVRTVALYAVPLLVALIGLGQQIATGSGTEFVKSALNVVPAIFGHG